MSKGNSLVLPVFFALACYVGSSHAENLLDVYWVAEKQEPSLRGKEAARQGAREVHKQSVSALLPQADLDLNATSNSTEYGNISSDSDSTGYSVSVSQSIYDHSTYKQLAKTRTGIAQADAEFEAAQRDLMLRVAERYFTVLATQDNLEFIRSEKEAVGRQLEQTRQRFEVGLIAVTDVHESQAAFDLAVASEIAAENDLSNARESLRELTGKYHDSLSKLSEDMPLEPPDPSDPKFWVDNALAKNFTLIAARAQVDGTRQEFRRQQAGHFPTLDLVGQYTYNDDGGISFNDQSVTNSSIALQLNVPLSRGGGTVARTGEARYKLDQANESLEQTTRAVYRSTNNAYLSVLATISRIKALNQAVISTRSALSASEAGLEVGTRTTVDVLNTRRELFRAQRDHSRARYDYILNILTLKESAGMLAIADFEQMVQWLN